MSVGAPPTPIRVALDGAAVRDERRRSHARQRPAGRTGAVDVLSPREREVIAEMARGANNESIGAALGLSERAVEKHVGAIFLKLDLKWQAGVNRRVKAVLLYLGYGEA